MCFGCLWACSWFTSCTSLGHIGRCKQLHPRKTNKTCHFADTLAHSSNHHIFEICHSLSDPYISPLFLLCKVTVHLLPNVSSPLASAICTEIINLMVLKLWLIGVYQYYLHAMYAYMSFTNISINLPDTVYAWRYYVLLQRKDILNRKETASKLMSCISNQQGRGNGVDVFLLQFLVHCRTTFWG